MFVRMLIVVSVIFAQSVTAGMEEFSTGPVFDQFGPNAAIEGGLDQPASLSFKVAFDAVKPTADGQNKSFESVARFINMHVRAGVPVESIRVALVVHGKATLELLSEAAYTERFERANPMATLLQALLDQGVEIVVCGQSAVAQNVAADQLIDGVQMSLSAMTAHALLQQEGYTLNPF